MAGLEGPPAAATWERGRGEREREVRGKGGERERERDGRGSPSTRPGAAEPSQTVGHSPLAPRSGSVDGAARGFGRHVGGWPV